MKLQNLEAYSPILFMSLI